MIVTLLTDYGYDDEFAGICRGVIARIAPEARIIDIAHGIPRHDVRRGAIVLRNAIDYLPMGVHVAVVDPTVGTPRRALAIGCEDGHLLVGPDNGLLSLAWERCGGIARAVDITLSPHRLEPVSSTFHGRDLFAAVAGRLAAGADLEGAGERIDPDELVAIRLPAPLLEDGSVVAHALVIDHFGNVGLNLTHEQLAGTGLALGRAVDLEVAGSHHGAVFAHTFADVDEGGLLLYEDAYRVLALAVNRGSAAALLGLAPDDQVRLTPA
jgi:S-adenosyl-L-methionine hydrolase (adenosine-forming)